MRQPLLSVSSFCASNLEHETQQQREGKIWFSAAELASLPAEAFTHEDHFDSRTSSKARGNARRESWKRFYSTSTVIVAALVLLTVSVGAAARIVAETRNATPTPALAQAFHESTAGISSAANKVVESVTKPLGKVRGEGREVFASTQEAGADIHQVQAEVAASGPSPGGGR